MKKKTSISDDKVKEILIDGINKGANYILNKSNFYEHIRTIHMVGKQRCLRLYDRYYTEAQQARNDLKVKEGVEVAANAVKRDILSRDQRMEIASYIAQGKARKIDGKIIYPYDGDRIKALEYLSKMDGDFAPEKRNVKAEISAVTPEQIAALAKEINGMD